MDITYGEEIPLDAVAPLFAQSKASTSAYTPPVHPSSTLSPSHHHPQASTSKLTDNSSQDDEEMEEGELLEEGEISEESSDESELVAETLIAPAYNPKKRDSISLPPVSFPKQDLSLRIAPPLTSPPALPLPSSSSHLPPRSKPIPASSSTRSISKPPASLKNDIGISSSVTPLQEYEKLIDELYSYGVTCDYLINKGVTKDLVVGTFAQKGYKLPQHHLNRHLERQRQWHEHQANLVGQQAPTPQHRQPLQERQQPQAKQESASPRHFAQLKLHHQPLPTNQVPPPSLPNLPSIPPSNPNGHQRSVSNLSDTSLMRMGALLPTPPSSAPSTISTKRRRESQDISSSVASSLPPPPTQPSSTATATATADKLTADLQALKEELARKEASAREALRARKAALAKQNAQRAENFIEGLLSASTAVEMPIASSSAPPQAMPAEMPPIASTLQTTSQPTSDLEDYEEGEEVETATPLLPSPPAATAASSTDPPPVRPPSAHRTLSSTSFNQTPRLHRPKATDFEADPSHSLPNVPRWTEQLLESQRRLASASEMVIDLSDSEEEDNNDGYYVGDDDDDDDSGDLDCYSSGRIDEQVRQAAKENNVDEQLRQAVRASKMQDAVAFSSYNGHHQSSIYNPYSSYSLSNIVKASESARSSPAPIAAAGVARRRVSPAPATSRGPTPHLSINRSITSASTTSAPLSAPAWTSAAGHATMSGNAELEAKQAEIKKMMEMIAKMESSKKQKKQKDTHATTSASMERKKSASSQASKETSSAPAAPPSNEVIETQQVESVVLQAAKEKVGQLLDEQEQLVSVMHTDEKEVGPLSSNATLPVPSSTVMSRGSSSDEAMSISSGDE